MLSIYSIFIACAYFKIVLALLAKPRGIQQVTANECNASAKNDTNKF